MFFKEKRTLFSTLLGLGKFFMIFTLFLKMLPTIDKFLAHLHFWLKTKFTKIFVEIPFAKMCFFLTRSGSVKNVYGSKTLSVRQF